MYLFRNNGIVLDDSVRSFIDPPIFLSFFSEQWHRSYNSVRSRKELSFPENGAQSFLRISLQRL